MISLRRRRAVDQRALLFALSLGILGIACDSGAPPIVASDATIPEDEMAPQTEEAARETGALESSSHRFRRMAPGVYHAVGTGRVNVVSNSMVVVNEDHVVVVDSHVTPDAARALVESVAGLTDKPIRYLINTHHHFDHAHGNAGFPDDVLVIGHEETRDRLAGNVAADPVFQLLGSVEAAQATVDQAEARLVEASPDARAAIEGEVAMLRRHLRAAGEAAVRPPELTLRERLTLHGGGREIRVLYLGRGHTAGDVVVYLPAERILFTGDLLQPGAPFLGDAHPEEWIATLDRLQRYDVEWVLPGHGEPFQGTAEFDRTRLFLRTIVDNVRALRAGGASPSEAAAALELPGFEEYAAWMLASPAVMELQVRRLYALDD